MWSFTCAADVVFVGSVDFVRYIKSDTDLRALRESYLRGDVVFNVRPSS